MLPTITMSGNLTADPDLKFTANGQPVANFTVASNASKKDDSGKWVVTDTTFLRCTLWGARAEAIVEVLGKGSAVVVVGKLKQSSYTNSEGKTVSNFEVNVESVGMDISKSFKPLGAAAPTPADPWATSSSNGEAPF
jgi:single-strand DNA-binding protein